MTETTTKENQEAGALIELPTINLPATTEIKAKVHEAFEQTFDKIREEIQKSDADPDTEEGRDELRSLAYKIARTKTGLDKAAKELVEEQRGLISAVNEERREMKETLDALRDKVRDPVTKWEETEKLRLKTVAAAFAFIENWASQEHEGVIVNEMSAEQLREFGAFVTAKQPCNADVFLDEAEEYEEGVRAAVTSIREWTERKQKAEDEAAELAELRAQKEREEAEREERERLEAEQKRRDDEERERAAEAARVAEKAAQDKIDEEKRQRAEAERRAEEAEQKRIEAEKEAERQRAALEEKAEADRKEAERQREADKRAAEEQRKLDEERAEAERKEAARKAEEDKTRAVEEDRRKRRQAELAREEAEKQRAADLDHRRKINNEIVEAIAKSTEIGEGAATVLVSVISDFKIPHLKIDY